jgi:hypothetical protein
MKSIMRRAGANSNTEDLVLLPPVQKLRLEVWVQDSALSSSTV